MIAIIYRKSDRRVVHYVYPRRTEEQFQRAIEAGIQMISDCGFDNESGGNPVDYGFALVSELQSGHEPTISPSGAVDFRPVINPSAAVKSSAVAKLEALGLTAEELRALRIIN